MLLVRCVVTHGTDRVQHRHWIVSVTWRGRLRARGHRRRQGQREAAAIQGDQHITGQPQAPLSGTYHAFDFAKYAHHYLAEAQYRFNRRFNLRSILARLLRAACPPTPAPAHIIHVAEVGRESSGGLTFKTVAWFVGCAAQRHICHGLPAIPRASPFARNGSRR
jgi:hypothetical protein